MSWEFVVSIDEKSISEDVASHWGSGDLSRPGLDEVTRVTEVPDGYSKFGPGPLDAIRMKWTARRLNEGWYVVDETFGASIAVTSEPMPPDRVIGYIDRCQTTALNAYEAARRIIERKSLRLVPSARDERVVAEEVGVTATATQNVERPSEVFLATLPAPEEGGEAVPAAVAVEIEERAISDPIVEPPSSVDGPKVSAEWEAIEMLQTQTLPKSDQVIELENPSEKLDAEEPGTAIPDEDVENKERVDVLARIAAGDRAFDQDQYSESEPSKDVSGEGAVERMGTTILIAEPNVSHEISETPKQAGEEASAGDIDHVLRQVQDVLARHD